MYGNYIAPFLYTEGSLEIKNTMLHRLGNPGESRYIILCKGGSFCKFDNLTMTDFNVGAGAIAAFNPIASIINSYCANNYV